MNKTSVVNGFASVLLAGCVFALPAGAAEKNLKVFILAGQSNMAGLGDIKALPPIYTQPPGNVKMWRQSDKVWTPLRTAGNTDGQFGPEITFAHTMAKAMPDAEIGIIKYASGGTALYNDWAPTEGPQYKHLMDTVRTALADLDAAGTPYEITAMLWLQGESDAHERQADSYEKNLTDFIEHMREQFKTPGMPFVIARVWDFYGKQTGQADIVRRAQVKIAEEHERVEWFDTDDCPPLDHATTRGHYNGEGLILIGTRFAESCLKLLGKSTPGGPRTVYMIGNSFTHNAEPYSLPALAEQKSDSLTVGAHIKSGSPVHNIWGRPDVAREVNPDFGTYRAALPNHPWDAVTLQPFYKKPFEGFPQSTMQSDIDSILKFIELARENPANQKTKFYIFESWPFLWTGRPFQQVWDATTQDELTAPTMHTRDYYEHLVKRLKKKTDAEIHSIPVSEVLYELDKKMQAGEVPGINGIGEIMADKLHLDHGLGHYIASVTVYATLFGRNPAGLVKPEGHYDAEREGLFTPQILNVLHDVIWTVVSSHAYTGVANYTEAQDE